jgi:hypothetical protein
MTIPQKYPLDFHTQLTNLLLRDTVPSNDLHRYLISLGYVRTLIEVKYQDKALTLVKEGEENTPILVLADEFRKRNYYERFPDKIDSDVLVTPEQIDEWNQVFIDALKDDPFFGKQMSTPTDISGSVSALPALRGKSSIDATQLMVNGVSGLQVDWRLPMYIQLKGEVDHSKTTDGITGLVTYRFGNTVVGIIQSYANEFNAPHTEASMIVAQSLRNMFVESQLGSVSFDKGSGIRFQMRVGVNTPHVMPFVQLTHRDFWSKSDTAAYVGLEVPTIEFKTSEYTFNTQWLAKIGHQREKGSIGTFEGIAKLFFSQGLTVDTQLTLGSNDSTKLSLNVSFEQ